MKRPQNAKAAAQRLAKSMATSADDEEEGDDLLYDFEPIVPSGGLGLGLAGGRQAKNRPSVQQPRSIRPSPAIGNKRSAAVNSVEHRPTSLRVSSLSPSLSKPAEQPLSPGSSQLQDSTEEALNSPLPTLGARTPSAANPVEQRPLSAHASHHKLIDSSPSLRSSLASPSFQSADAAEEAEPTSARSNAPGRSLSYANSFSPAEQPLSARSIGSIGRPNLRVKTGSYVPPAVPLPNKPVQYGTPTESQHDKNRDKRSSLDFGSFKYKEPVSAQQSSSALQDELDMLQEENDSLLERLRLTEERCEEAESRSRQLEKQIASLGEGVSLESRLLSRKEADIQKREAALKAASEHCGGDKVVALREEAEAARNEANSLRITTQRTVLSQDEMEEVILKRCWLARCWSLCVQYGIHGEIAEARYEYWSRYAWRPVEILLATGRKAKDENTMINNDLEEREKVLEQKDHLRKRPNVESMLLVEKGLRELGELKVEEAIVISMAQKRRQSMLKYSATDELKLPGEGCSYAEAFELTPDEVEDVLLKQALLLYFWRRAKNAGLEADVAEERLQYWIKQGDKRLNSHDAVNVDRGLVELRKLAVETKLWEEARRQIDPDDSEQTLLEAEYQILPC